MQILSFTSRFGHDLGDAIEFYRKIAFEIDKDPQNIFKYLDHPASQLLLFPEKMSCVKRVRYYEALSYGDPGVLLAMPGASLAGFLIHLLANDWQKNIFYETLKNKTCTFLAVTEPFAGSQLSSLKTFFVNGKLKGEKYLVSHGATGKIGVVIVKTCEGPLGVRTLLMAPEYLDSKHIQRTLLPMTGLRGACLSHLIFKNLKISPDLLLGQHLSAAEYGMMGLLKTFNQMRPCVGAMAIGVCQAVIDYIYEIKSLNSYEGNILLKKLQSQINLARNLLYFSAKQIDQNPFESGYSSLAKVRATQTVECVLSQIIQHINLCDFISHPFLMKWYRDMWGFEYMEGVADIHKINVFNTYRKKIFTYHKNNLN